MDWGMKEKNPINNMRFYCKNDPTKAYQISKDQVTTSMHLRIPILELSNHFWSLETWYKAIVVPVGVQAAARKVCWAAYQGLL